LFSSYPEDKKPDCQEVRVGKNDVLFWPRWKFCLKRR